MVIKEIKEKSIWEKFFLNFDDKSFLQSWSWGEFQEKKGNKIWRLGQYDGEEISLAVLAVKVEAKRGTFLLIQHCVGISELLLSRLTEIAKEEKCIFIRMAPLLQRNEKNDKIFRGFGFRESPMHASAYEATWKLDLTRAEEDILRSMRKTTRYLIKKLEKDPDITVEKSGKIEDIEIYQELNKKVAERQKFVPFSDRYIKNEFEVFSKDNQSLWFFGKYKGQVAAASLVVFWSGIGFYHQAASDAKYAKHSVPYLLQWEAIKESKRRGCKLYDFWGFTDPVKEPKHPWAGPTLFKMGFGGYKKEYIKTRDFPLSKKYWVNWVIEKLRKTKRGL